MQRIKTFYKINEQRQEKTLARPGLVAEDSATQMQKKQLEKRMIECKEAREYIKAEPIPNFAQL